jgi:protein disulfide-isomerase A1
VGEDTIKYKPESSDIKSGVLIKFVNDYFDGKLRGLYSSQEIPEDWDKGSVKILVGKNFAEVAYDKTKTVLAAFVASW